MLVSRSPTRVPSAFRVTTGSTATPIVVRPGQLGGRDDGILVAAPYHLLQRISTLIAHKVLPVNLVVLDVTSKPPGTIAWESSRSAADARRPPGWGEVDQGALRRQLLQ